MSTDVTKTTEPRDHLSWGIVELQVTNLERAVAFWTDAIGLYVRSQDDARADLGNADTTLIVLHAGATRPVSPAHLGMYHVAIGVADQAEFSRVLARLISKRVPVSPTDHLASKSIYFSDPDNLEIEIIYETPERFGSFGDLSKGLIMYDKDGNPHSGRAPLDVQSELAHARDADLEALLNTDSFLAHVHFKAPSLETTSAWFEGIGFDRSLMIPAFGFADMSAGGKSAHRLAMNIWQGQGLSPAPSDMARMVRYALWAHTPDVFDNAQGLTETTDGLAGRDPSGIDIVLRRAY